MLYDERLKTKSYRVRYVVDYAIVCKVHDHEHKEYIGVASSE